MKVEIVYYATARGDLPVRNYIEALPNKDRMKVKALVDYLSEMRILGEPHAKKIMGFSGLFELRPGAHRIFYCYDKDRIVLLHAFRKKSAKTPLREINLAYTRLREF